MSSFHILLLFLIIIVPAGALACKLMNGKKDLIEVECEILTLENNGEMSSSWRGKLRYYIDGKEYINSSFVFYKLNAFWHGDSIILGYGLLLTGMIVCVIFIWITVSMNRRQNTKK